MFSLQNFQNLATFQQQKLSLVGLAAASCLNSPLNLSLGSSASSTTPLEVNNAGAFFLKSNQKV